MNPISALQISFQNNKGFSLIEIMVALGIFSIGILAVASMQISAAQGNLSARLRTEAVTLASDRLEILAAMPYALVDSGATTERNFDLVWTVTDGTPVSDAKTIIVTITWQDRGTERSTSLNYVRANLI